MKKGDKIQVPYFGFDFVYLGVSPNDKTKVEFSIQKPFLPLNNYQSFYQYFEKIVKLEGGDNFDIDSYQTKLVFTLPKKNAEGKITDINTKFNILLGLFNKDNVFSNAEDIKDAEVVYFFWQFKIGLYKSNISDAYILYLNSPLFENTQLSETLSEFIRKSIFSINSVQTKHLGNNESWVVFQFDPSINLTKNYLVGFIWWLQGKYETYSKPFALNIQQNKNLQPYYLLPKSNVQIYSIEKTPYFTFTPPNPNPTLKQAIEKFAIKSLPLNDFPSFISNQDNSWTFTMGNISLTKQEEYFEKLDNVLDFVASNQPTATTFPPKYFAVKNDGSAEFREFIKWFNKTYQTNYNGSTNWYGFDNFQGERAVSNLVEIGGNPQQFTAKEFMDNLNGIQQPNVQQPTATTFPPKYFIVKRDNTDDYKDFIDWLNEKYNVSVSGTMFEWYGVNDERKDKIVADDDASSFKGNPQQFTAKEFMDNLRASSQATQQTTPQSSATSTFPPKYFMVKKDSSDDFRDYLDWLNNEYPRNFWFGQSNSWQWYGVDSDRIAGSDAHYDNFNFKKNPQIFTAKEFMDNLRVSQMPTQSQPTPTKKVTSSNDYSQKIEQLKKEIAEGMFLKSIISPIEFEKRIEIEQSISKKQKEINELNFKTFEEKFEGSGVFDELFEQSFVTLQHDYTNIYTSNTNEEFADYFTPNGKASKYSDEVNELIRTPQFKEWFGDWELSYFYKDIEGVKLDCSKVLNENYEPLIVWHGTGREFSYFKYDTFPASYFAVNKDYAKWFADLHGGDDGYVLPFFLNIKNPLDLTHFGTRQISTKDFFDYMYLQTGLDIEGLEVNPIFADSSFKPVETWVYLRNNPKMLKKISELQIFDGIHFYETNPSVPTGEKAHETEVWITFKPDQAKLADPSRGTILMASLKSFILKRGGKI